MWRRKEGDSLSSEVKCFHQVSFLFILATAEKTNTAFGSQTSLYDPCNKILASCFAAVAYTRVRSVCACPPRPASRQAGTSSKSKCLGKE